MSQRPNKFEKKVAKFFFGYKARSELYTQLISLLETDMPTTAALEMSWDVASQEGKKPKEMAAIVLSEVILSMKNGETLSQALKPWVPQEDVMVFEAIENSENFAGNLRDYMDMLEKKRKIKSSIIGGMIYPAFMLAIVFGIITYFGKTVVPMISEILPVEEWRGMALVLTYMYKFANTYVGPAVIGMIVCLIAITISMPRWSGYGRVFADKLPIFSTYRMYTGISFLMSMASLIQGGMPATDALNRLHPQASPYVRDRILRIRNQMLDGNNLGAAMYRAKTDWPDRKMNLSIKIFAETQDLSKQLSRLSKTWLEQSQSTIDAKMGFLKMAVIVLVFLTILSIVAGTYGLQSQVSTSLGGF